MKYNIISIPRSGSGYLRSLIAKNLETNDNFYTISEPFNPTKNRSISYEEMIKCMSMSDTVVTKNHIFDLLELKNTNEELYQSFIGIDFIHVCLLRRDLFECTLSRCVAKITNQWNEYTYSENDNIVVPEYFFMSELKDTVDMLDAISTLNLDFSKVIYYEDLTFNSEKDCELFGIQYNGADVTYQKSPNKNMIVSNIDVLKQSFFNEINTVSVSNIEGL